MAGYPNPNHNHGHSYQAYQPSYQPYSDRRDRSPIEGDVAQFPSPGQSMDPPPPPAHRNPVGVQPDNQMQTERPYGSHNYSDFSPPSTTSGITPGADNLGETAAGGGINGMAIGVASANERESGAQALRDIDNWGRNGAANMAGPRRVPSERDPAGTPFADQYRYEQPMPPRPIQPQPQPSYASNVPLAAGAIPPASIMSPSYSSSERSLTLGGRPTPPHPASLYDDSPYNRYSSSNLQLAPQMGAINPVEADDDDDWGMGPQQTTQQKRRSFVPFTSTSRDTISREGTPGAAAAVGGATAGATAYAAARDASGNYNAVPGGSAGGSAPELPNEKSDWLSSQHHGSKRLRWIVGTLIVLVVVGAIVGGVLGATLSKKHGGGGGGGGGSTAASVEQDNKNDLDKNSPEIQKLLNNKNLHKVFPGMDYTPLNTQYPDCMHVPPSQNNITRDMAVLSQLTNAVRLYGTDCNQTEMVLHAIDRLDIKSSMKVWLGVWLGKNETTNDRQIAQMWNILDDAKADKSLKTLSDRFKGIIIGNEVLYREDLNETALMNIITTVKKNLTDNGINDLHIATSDLGDNWTAEMATQVDIVMSNVHPFFAGVTAKEAAGWTWSFWTTHDVSLTKGTNIKQIVAEVGWPSKGGKNCGEAVSCAEGSVAGIDEMNTFMDNWVCQSLANGTEYFWFEAFDEPWKIQFNTAGKNWEDQWGLMDVNRNLKDGVVIPDCGGQTAS